MFNRIKALLVGPLLISILIGVTGSSEFYIIKVDLDPVNYKQQIDDLKLDLVNSKLTYQPEIVGNAETIDLLVQNGIQHNIIKTLDKRFIPDYPSYDDIVNQMNSWAASSPDLVSIHEIGVSQQYHTPVYAIKISDNPNVREDETVVWIDGVHHAREPMGAMCCMNLAEHLITNYSSDNLITELVDTLETWIVPVLNPEGYMFFIDSTTVNPWWRKNMRDNNRSGIFESVFDGVDLNRNYDCNWEGSNDGSPEISSWVYKGVAPFSESELVAKKEMVEYLRPIAGMTYHSYSEAVGIPIGVSQHAIPETNLLNDFAYQVASRIPRLYSIGHYQLWLSWSDSPMSHPWMFKSNGTYEVLIETGTEFVPDFTVAEQVVDDNLNSALYVLERSMNGPGIRGHVISSLNGEPVEAVVQILEYWDDDLVPRRNEPVHGRFNRLTDPGIFTVIAHQHGYASDTVRNVSVSEQSSGWSDIKLVLDPVSILELELFTLDDDTIGFSSGNGDAQINSGEIIELNLEIKNTGALVSNQVLIKMTIDDPYVEVYDSTGNVLSIEPDSSQMIISAFNFKVHENCPSGHVLQVMVQLSDSTGSSWTFEEFLPVYDRLHVQDNNSELVYKFRIGQNYPNPFNPVTNIDYTIEEPSKVLIKVYDLLGNEIKTLVSDIQAAGHHRVRWDATDKNGNLVSAGVYLYSIQSGQYSKTNKMLLIK